jgi:four helix bundle protein
MEARIKIQSFTDLVVWKEGHRLVLNIYRITKKFPKEEIFALTSQIKRAVVSITSNIAEGFSRNSKKEKLQFYAIALGSLTEVHNQLLIAQDLKYISQLEFDEVKNQTVTINKLIHGLMKSAQNHYT